MRVLHTYLRVDIPRSTKVRFAVVRLNHTVVRPDGEETVIPHEVWSTGEVDFHDANAMARARREAFVECCRRNGAKPRRVTYDESIAIAAELRAMNRRGGHHGQ